MIYIRNLNWNLSNYSTEVAMEEQDPRIGGYLIPIVRGRGDLRKRKKLVTRKSGEFY
jgi:hypothetical protein